MNAAGRPPVRIGVLGAAKIVADALLTPSASTDGVTVAGIAARDPQRARAFAQKHGIPVVHDDYEALLADPEIDAVYLPLPAALHAPWAVAAIDAGKHVLVEKPFASNAEAAEQVASRAAGASTVVMEAYHSAHHPLLSRVRALVESGEIGAPVSAAARFTAPIPPGRDIRWNLALGGGGLLDVGYYPVRVLRELFGAAPVVRSARAKERDGIDRLLVAELDFGGVTATVTSGIWTTRLGIGLEVRGEAGSLRVSWPYHPQLGAKIRIDGAGGRRVEAAERVSSYALQLAAFRDAVREGAPVLTDAPAAVAQLRTIDAIYAAAGMHPRPSF